MISKSGTVVAKSGLQTIRVSVGMQRKHSKYQKQHTITHQFLVHDKNEVSQVGDVVEIIPGRKISKNKSWYLKDILKKSTK